LAARARVDLVHSLASTAPLKGAFRRVVTVHDLIYARFPDAHAGIRDKGMRLLVPAAARRSDRVITDSESTRRDVLELIGIDSSRIDVVPLGLGAVSRATPTPESELRELFALGDRQMLLSVSAKRPHKNLLALIDALAAIPVPERPVLVLPGYPTEHERELRTHAEQLGLSADVRFPAWVSEEQLEGLWRIARVFVFPSLYEGFGLPVLEAMARGVPVACSNSSSLPELAGDAALTFDPRSQQQLTTCVQRLMKEEVLRANLIARGHARVARFTWGRTAELTLESYARALA
ncbi:MAG TPA: glycosyltransferase family 1 protein, partial [Solirubrobacteraceae bacterium]|nr:glycosyltransferase family 1 protein [Solirubrobacteraceae bacterium]